jgi:AbrB family looped-hinge helix DNA binding protein
MSPYRTVVSSKGQVVIPAELRQEFQLEKGARATWTKERGRLVLTPIGALLDEIQGCLTPKPGAPTMFDELFKEREKERERERRRERNKP